MKNKILFFSNCFIFGGCENVLVNLINNKKMNKIFHLYYAFGYNKEYTKGVKKYIFDGVNKYSLPLLVNSGIFYRLNLVNNDNLFKKVLFIIIKVILAILQIVGIYSIWNIIVIYFLLKIVKPDILFINNGGYPADLSCRNAVFSAKIAGINNIIFNVNNMAQKRNNIFAKWEDIFIRINISIFITASLMAKKKLIENIGVEEEKTKQVFNTCNSTLKINRQRDDLLNEYQIQKNKIIITEVGLLTKRKGQIYLLKALKDIRIINQEVFNDIIIFIVGDGEERRNLENYICENDLNNNVILTGFRDDDIDYINAADIFVLPSDENEDMPYVILYAMSLKTTIISTKSAGIVEEIRNGIDGILLEINERDKLSESILKLIDNKNLRNCFSENAYKRFNDCFSYENIIDQYICIFNSLLLKNR